MSRDGLQQRIELEVAAVLDADRHARTEERLGHRPRSLTTQMGDLGLLIPKRRAGRVMPSIFEPRRRLNQALDAVILKACIGGSPPARLMPWRGPWASQSGISSRACGW